MLNQSFKNLNIDYIYSYIYHMWDYQTAIYNILERLHNMIKNGKTRYIGISNYFAWQLAKANAIVEVVCISTLAKHASENLIEDWL